MNKEIIRIDKNLTRDVGQVYNLLPALGKKENKKVVLEIGCGLYTSDERKKKTSDSERYLGIDANPNLVSVPNYDKTALIIATAKKLPLRGGSVDKVIMCNVVGHILVKWENFIEEIRRVLDPNGKIVIVETLTPNVIKVEDLEKSMNQYGFEINREKGIYDYQEINRYSQYRPSSYSAEFLHSSK